MSIKETDKVILSTFILYIHTFYTHTIMLEEEENSTTGRIKKKNESLQIQSLTTRIIQKRNKK